MKENKIARKCMVVGFLVVLIIYAIVGMTCYAVAGQNKAYDVAKAVEWLERAQTSNDLLKQADYLNESLKLLGNYHGNPCWIFPKPDTDFDLIKENLRENIVIAQETSKISVTNMSYQFAVQNLERSIEELQGNLGGAKMWLYFTPTCMFMWISYIVLLILFVLITILSGGDDPDDFFGKMAIATMFTPVFLGFIMLAEAFILP